ncbi:MAG: recombinase family protein [Oscillospiraceae bacterium]|nr:recombinase family protein [Oscillospiraceae bacterium]
MKKIFLYIRLSDADDDLKNKTESNSVANQRALLYQYIKTHEELRLYEAVEFIDDGFSGTNDRRPSFERMIEALKNGESKLVLCKDFSRFFRDYVEIGDYLERIFPFLGVRFISVNDGYDSDDYKGTTGGMDVVMRYIVYSYYSRDLSQKIKTVLRSKIKHGEYIASHAPYGYIKDPVDKHKLIPDPVAAPIVQRIFALAVEGKNTGQIATILNEEHVETPAAHFARIHPDSKKHRKRSAKQDWSATSVRYIIERPEYTGANVSYKRDYKSLDHPVSSKKDKDDWLIIPNCNVPLVSQEVYEKAQSAYSLGKNYTKRKLDYPLRSLLRCGECGRALTRHSTAKRVYYQCESSRYSAETTCPLGERFYDDELERAVIGSLRQMLELLVDHDKKIREAAARTKGSMDNMKQTVLRLESKIKRNQSERLGAYERYSDGKISRGEYLAIRDKLTEENAQMQTRLTKLQENIAALEARTDPEMELYGSEARAFLKAGNVTNEMLLFFISRVKVYSGMRLEIEYRFSDELMEALGGGENG